MTALIRFGDIFSSGTSIRCSLKIVKAVPVLGVEDRRRLRHVAEAVDGVALRQTRGQVVTDPGRDTGGKNCRDGEDGHQCGQQQGPAGEELAGGVEETGQGHTLFNARCAPTRQALARFAGSGGQTLSFRPGVRELPLFRGDVRMKRRILSVALAAAAASAALIGAQEPAGLTANALKGLELRSIGPTLTTGRVQDIEIDPKNPSVWYVASAFGGLWKTENRGITFTPIFDSGGSFTLCCVVIDPKDSNVVWLGTGENTSQRSAHFGDGVYKSTDAGKTWKRVGLADLRAHRQDPDRSAQLERRLRRGAGAALLGGRRARPLQDDRRRRDLDRAS